MILPTSALTSFRVAIRKWLPKSLVNGAVSATLCFDTRSLTVGGDIERGHSAWSVAARGRACWHSQKPRVWAEGDPALLKNPELYGQWSLGGSSMRIGFVWSTETQASAWGPAFIRAVGKRQVRRLQFLTIQLFLHATHPEDAPMHCW